MAKYTDDNGNIISTKQFTAEVAEGIRALKSNLRDEILGELGLHGAVNRPRMGDGAGDGDYGRDKSLSAIAGGDDAPGRQLDGQFRSLGHLARDISPRALQVKGLPEAYRNISNDMSSIDPSSGGFLIPEEFRRELLTDALETAIVRPRATVIPMNTASITLPTYDVTSHASTLFGGTTFAWVEEGGSIGESNPTFGRIKLIAAKLAGYSELPNELIQDSPISVDVFLGRAFAEGIAFEEDAAFLTGNGVGQPLGVLNSGALVTVTKEGGQVNDTIVWENIIKIWQRVLPASQGRGVWVANINCFAELATMSLSVGVGGSAIWLQAGQGSQPGTILGRPLILTEKVPTLGDAGDIGFYDFSAYIVADRMQMSIAASPHLKFQQDMTAFRIIERVDGRPGVLSAIVPRKGTDSLSPFVCLGAR